MFRRAVTLGRLFGIPVRVDATWLIIAVLVTWSLAAGFFPRYHPGLPGSHYWWMALAGALGLFLSILFHEFAHALVARHYGVRIRAVTLFVFGGVGEMQGEPPHAKAEFWIAIAGPISSTFLAILSVLPYLAGIEPWLPPGVQTTLYWLALVNTMLAGFNLIPAFPLDGGRVLRSFVWRWTGSLHEATRQCARVGSGFGLMLMLLGGLQFLGGNLIGGIWFFFIGFWLRRAATASLSQSMLREFLEGEPVRAFMKRDPVVVTPDLTLDALVHDYVYRHQFKMFPVVENGSVLGCVTLRRVASVPRQEWGRHAVGELVIPCSDETCVPPDADVMEAVATMSRTGNSRVLVVERGRLVGILALKDVLGFFALKMELEGRA